MLNAFLDYIISYAYELATYRRSKIAEGKKCSVFVPQARTNAGMSISRSIKGIDAGMWIFTCKPFQ